MSLVLLPLLLSEVLANEPGSATSLEFVELVARQPVQEGFLIFDANGKTVAVPVLPLDSGAFLVMCRDAERFEQHFGDSSGAWGDASVEDYLLQEFALSLPNGAGYVALLQGATQDRFDWSGDAPDGVSYERVSDSLWQTTHDSQGSTPGRRNHGTPPEFDWAIEGVVLDPVLPKSGAPAQLTVNIRNAGLNATSVGLTVTHEQGDTLLVHAGFGQPGERVEVSAPVIPRAGPNVIEALLTGDDRSSNNFVRWPFYADTGPLIISEVYPAPSPAEPEWFELFAPLGFDSGMTTLAVADHSDTAFFSQAGWPPWEHRLVVFTEDSTMFALAFPEIPGPVIQPDRWPSLNNDGDTLVLSLQGIAVDRAGIPSAGSRRGVSWERVGTSQVWGWSVAPRGSTPGRINSLDVTYSDLVEIDVSPNPFAAGLGEQATIQYQVPFGAEGELRLYRGDGRPVRTLFGRRPVVSGKVSWDGSGDEGAPVPVGIYIVQFRLYQPQERVHLTTVVVAR